MKPFRRTGFNVPLHYPLPKCRARRSWGTLPHACFSCFVLFASSKENEVAPAKPATQFMIRKEKVGPRSGHAGPSFSARPEKEAKGAVLRGTSAAERFSGRGLGLPTVPSGTGYETDQKPCFFVHSPPRLYRQAERREKLSRRPSLLIPVQS